MAKTYGDLLVEKANMQEMIDDLELQIAELQDPDWNTYIAITKKWLEQYPPDIFTGVSRDPGPLFVVAVRKAMNSLEGK